MTVVALKHSPPALERDIVPDNRSVKEFDRLSPEAELMATTRALRLFNATIEADPTAQRTQAAFDCALQAFKVSPDVVSSRYPSAVRVRHIIIACMHHAAPSSYGRIARFIGYGHGTVRYAAQQGREIVERALREMECEHG